LLLELFFLNSQLLLSCSLLIEIIVYFLLPITIIFITHLASFLIFFLISDSIAVHLHDLLKDLLRVNSHLLSNL